VARDSEIEFIDDQHLRVGSTRFYCAWPIVSLPDGHLPVVKRRALVQHYIDLFESFEARNIVELGIRRGGSTALIAELARPQRLVAIEIATTAAPALSDYIESRGLADVVRPHYGVDQADRARLAEIVDAEFGARRVDLVVDDASHLYEQTKSSFETLFPRLRPGGLFLIEDWNADHGRHEAIAARLHEGSQAERERLERRITQLVAERQSPAAPGEPLSRLVLEHEPLSRLVLELLLARASSSDAIDQITIDGHWVAVRRGAADLDHDQFRLAQLYHDHFGLLSRS
jgi:predicted O-methyltransferase YrrM